MDANKQTAGRNDARAYRCKDYAAAIAAADAVMAQRGLAADLRHGGDLRQGQGQPGVFQARTRP
jgi:hypothetical protein